MSDLAQYFGRHRWLVVGVAGATTTVPPLGFFGAAALAVWTLRHGRFAGLAALFMAATIAGAFNLFGGGPFLGGVLLAAVTLLPTVLLALVLRWQQSLDLAVQAATLGCLGLVLLVSLMVPDHADYWRQAFERFLDQGGGQALSDAEREQLLQAVPYAMLIGAAAANLLLASLGALFLGRSWQARVVNPGGFRREFHHLRLGRAMAVLAAVFCLAAVLSSAALPANLAVVMLAAWMVQGLAVVHFTAALRGWTVAWMVTFYVVVVLCLFMASPVLVLISLIGMADQLFNFRQRLTRAAGDKRPPPGSGQE